MLTIASGYSKHLVRAHEIARTQTISLKYLESILASLKAAGLIRSERGKHGGYALARPPEEITMLEVLRSLEDSLGYVHCTESDRACDRREICVTRDLWMELKAATEVILGSTSLADLLVRQEAKHALLGPDDPRVAERDGSCASEGNAPCAPGPEAPCASRLAD